MSTKKRRHRATRSKHNRVGQIRAWFSDVLDRVAAGADPNAPIDGSGLTPINALLGACVEMAIHDTRAHPPICTTCNQPHPIHINQIAWSGGAAELGVLLKHRADPNAPIFGGAAALWIAACFNLVDLIGPLLAAGADPLAKNDIGETPVDVLLRRDIPPVIAAFDQAMAAPTYPAATRAQVLAADPTAASKLPASATAHARAMADKNWPRPRAAAC